MSRSNPNDQSPNPATRWFEWSGEKGIVRYYDKDAKQTIEVGADLTFMLLDQLASVRGWHEPSQSGIYSNEVKDTRADVLVVKAFKEGILAQGLYKDIKDRVNSVGGHFCANLYLAFKDDSNELVIGSLRLKGAALGAWMEFNKGHRAEVYKKAVKITGYTEGKKGRVVYRVPTFALSPVSDDTNRIAVALDGELQGWLAAYLKRTTSDRVETTARHVADEDMMPPPPTDADAPFTDDEEPF